MNQITFGSVAAVIGVIFTYAFGEWTNLFGFLCMTIVVDYVTGIAASLREKKGLSSEIGFWGLAKKAFMLLIIMLAHQMDIVFEVNFIMIASLYFYLANQLISITENYGRMGLPLPNVIRKMIAVLRDKDPR